MRLRSLFLLLRTKTFHENNYKIYIKSLWNVRQSTRVVSLRVVYSASYLVIFFEYMCTLQDTGF